MFIDGIRKFSIEQHAKKVFDFKVPEKKTSKVCRVLQLL
jgi:hypothetical protein